jgi:hypothetical protein
VVDNTRKSTYPNDFRNEDDMSEGENSIGSIGDNVRKNWGGDFS